MILRTKIDQFLKDWSSRSSRRPLIVRGARQVGKTFSIKHFAQNEFKGNFIYLNIERSNDAALFKRMMPIRELIELIEIHARQRITPGETFLFIDEIQNSSIAMTQLRYFYEDCPLLHVVAAGSLLEVKMDKEGFSFPVGRVEFFYMHPLDFEEFLQDQSEVIDRLFTSTPIHISPEIHQIMMGKYMKFMSVGGMPEIVDKYLSGMSYIEIDNIYESLLTSMQEDVFKYSSMARANYIQHVLEYAPMYAGKYIKYEKFAESEFKSREIKDAFDVLEKAMLLRKTYGSPSWQLPIDYNPKKAVKLIYFDTGLVNHRRGIREKLLAEGETNLNSLYKGEIAEQTVGRALLSLHNNKNDEIYYWYRDQKGSTAELDFIFQYKDRIIPIEVKSGTSGTMKSLHIFMEKSRQTLAFKISSAPYAENMIQLDSGHTYKLICLPFYLVHKIERFC